MILPRAVVLLGTALVGACSGIGSEIAGVPEAERATLYRNSTLVSGMRIHWASFDADDSPSYNINNCMMAARLLNANLIASAEAEGVPPHQGVGFWCEPGSFRADGMVPGNFQAAYPTDA